MALARLADPLGRLAASGARLTEPPPPGAGVLDRARLGDRAALARLYERHGPDVKRLCRRLLGAGADVEDAQSEVFLRAQRSFAGYDPRQPFRRWLLSIAAHHCVDQLRRRQVEGRIFEISDWQRAGLPDRGPSPLGMALRAEQRLQLLEAVDALPPRYRVPVALRYFAELSYAEISEALDCSRSQVGVLLHRARVRLREALLANGGGES